jgi:Tfp pilus assembly ATPase PilU
MARRKKLELSIVCTEHGEVTRTLALHANNMNELVDKIISWQDWETESELLYKIAIKKNDPNYIASEKRSGWYYIKNKKKP